ncbi:MAG: hypothetical protein IKU10_07620 [Clostridia bacterium]|nr:hypothetical protein [Clostridia bacterium]
MKQIFGSEAIQIQPCQNGFIFVVKQEEHDQKAVVSYKMMDFERMTIAPITRNVYLLEKFGNQFERYEQNPDDFLNVRSLVLPDRRLLVVEPNGMATITGGDGYRQLQRDLSYQGCVPDHLVLAEDSFFASYPAAGAVIRYNAATLRQELRVGGGNRPMPTPEGLYYQNGQLLICMPTLCKIMELNFDTFELEEYETFEEPIHRYLKYNANEIVLLDSGAYKL